MEGKTIFIFIGILAILGINLWIAYFVFNHYEAFDNSALVYGARKYGIEQCTCNSPSGEIIFNQDVVRIINQATPTTSEEVNYTELENLFKK